MSKPRWATPRPPKPPQPKEPAVTTKETSTQPADPPARYSWEDELDQLTAPARNPGQYKVRDRDAMVACARLLLKMGERILEALKR
jgi:hypothetical protein